MMHSKFFDYLRGALLDTLGIFWRELRNVFTDAGVVLIFFVASIAYPLLYNYVYYNETVSDVPVAVIDQCSSSPSRSFVRKLDATKELSVVPASDMIQAEQMMQQRKVQGIVLIPTDYSAKLANHEQAYISVYDNMSCFLIFKTITLGVNHVMLDEMKNIQINRYKATGLTDESAQQAVNAVTYDDVTLYNPGGGFASFFLAALLIIVIHQTMFFGIGMETGTARESRRSHQLFNQAESRRGIFRSVVGRMAAYMFIYLLLTLYILVLIPWLFNLPHLGNYWNICAFILPFLLATASFSMTFAVFVKNRETGMILFLFFSVILIFLSGLIWTADYTPWYWRYLSYLFPSTFGVEGYVKINNMGADLGQVSREYIALWIQTFVYFILACLSSLYMVKSEEREG